MRPETKGTLAILTASLGYATLPVLGKLALDAGVGVLPLLVWRFWIGAGLVWFIVLAAGRPLPGRASVRPLLVLGVLYAANSLAYMLGLDRVTASLATLVFFTYPAVTVLLARIVPGEPLTARKLTALALASGGCALTVGGTVGGGDALGIAWLLVSVVLIAVFIVASHATFARVPEMSGSATLMTATALALTAAAVGAGEAAPGGEPAAVVYVGLLGVLSTALPVTLFLVGIKWIGPGKAAILSTLEPAYTLILAGALLGDRLTGLQLGGGALILAGVIWLRLGRDGRLSTAAAPPESG